MKLQIKSVEDAVLAELKGVPDADLKIRLGSVFRSAQYVHVRKKTDDIEYHGFLTGLIHSLQAINDECS